MPSCSLRNFGTDGAKSLVAMECLIRVPLPDAERLKLVQLLFLFLQLGKDLDKA